MVARIRKLARTKRVGHAGTLDPMATGVLVVGVEKATRLLGYLALTEKEYTATIRLGQTTSTDDADGEIIGHVPVLNLGEAELARRGPHRRDQSGPAGHQRDQGRRPARVQAGARGGDSELAGRTVTVREFAVDALRPAATYSTPTCG